MYEGLFMTGEGRKAEGAERRAQSAGFASHSLPRGSEGWAQGAGFRVQGRRRRAEG